MSNKIDDGRLKDREYLRQLLEVYEKRDFIVEYPFVEGRRKLRTEDIIYIETARHKNIFHTKEETFSLYRKLNEIEEDLKEMGFLRIHQSYLVNMRYIEKISSYILRLDNGKEISVPKSRYRNVKQRYAEYKGEESYDQNYNTDAK